MKSAQDRLRVAFNILSRNSIDSVDLYGEIAKAESFIQGMETQKLMQPPAAQMPLQTEQPMPQDPENNPIPTM